mgnify:CR=1 FL=1
MILCERMFIFNTRENDFQRLTKCLTYVIIKANKNHIRRDQNEKIISYDTCVRSYVFYFVRSCGSSSSDTEDEDSSSTVLENSDELLKSNNKVAKTLFYVSE